MSRKIERRFTVSASVERVWKVMTDPDELNKWYFPITVTEEGTTHTDIRGVDEASEVVDVEPMRMLHMRTSHSGKGEENWPSPPAGTLDMTVVLEATDSGTRVVITHSGFGDGEDWALLLEAMTMGVDEGIADLVLYLETGVPFPRHPSERCFSGIAPKRVPGGVEVMAVAPGSFADRLGLLTGDLLVELGGAAIFGPPELWFFTREHRPGEKSDAAWIRAGQLMRGSAELGSRAPVVTNAAS
jgi:uncharacterized protein YndB with AHSA1/START domain